MAIGDSTYTLTPGSAVASTLEAILARRREEAQQAMLEKIQQSERDRDEQFRRDQLASQNQYQNQNLDLQRSQEGRLANSSRIADAANQEQLDQLRLSQYEQPMDLAKIPDENIRNLMINRGMVDTQQDLGPPETGDAMPSRQVYRGSPAFQKEALAREQILGLQSQIDPEAQPELAQWLNLFGAGAGDVPTELLEPSEREAYSFDPDSRKLTPTGVKVPKGAPILQGSSAASRLRPNLSAPLQGTSGPNGEPVVIDEDTGALIVLKVPPGVTYRTPNVFDEQMLRSLDAIAADTRFKSDDERYAAYVFAEDSLVQTSTVSNPIAKEIMYGVLADLRDMDAKQRPLPPIQSFINGALNAVPEYIPNRDRVIGELRLTLPKLVQRYYQRAARR